jgi:hypothetical protein
VLYEPRPRLHTLSLSLALFIFISPRKKKKRKEKNGKSKLLFFSFFFFFRIICSSLFNGSMKPQSQKLNSRQQHNNGESLERVKRREMASEAALSCL